MNISKLHSVKVTHLPWAQATPCLRTERKARHRRRLVGSNTNCVADDSIWSLSESTLNSRRARETSPRMDWPRCLRVY